MTNLVVAEELFWEDKLRFDDAERSYYEKLAKNKSPSEGAKKQPRKNDAESKQQRDPKSDKKSQNQKSQKIAVNDESARQPLADSCVNPRIQKLEKENQTLKATVESLQAQVKKLESRLQSLELAVKPSSTAPAKTQKQPEVKNAKNQSQAKKEEEDDDIDLFGSDEDEEADEARQKRVAAYAEKKAKKPGVIAKSSVVLDVKPWDDETDMSEMEKQVRTIEMDGLLWGASKLVPLAYGIKKLQIVTVIEDDKVSVDELTEKIEAIEDLVQSVDIAAFNKI